MSKDIYFSRVVLGFWRVIDWKLNYDELLKFIEECLDMGITTFDHADIYANYTAEEYFGHAVSKRPDLRKKMQLVTKCTIVYKSDTARVKYYNSSKNYIIQQVEKSLKNLHTDYIDALLLHRPDMFMDPEQVNLAFEQLYKEGKVRSFGVSNYKPNEYRMLESYLSVPLITNQIELSPLNMENIENGTLNLCYEKRIHPMIWSPLAGGRIFTEQSETASRLRAAMEEIRGEIGASCIDEVAFSWLLSHPIKVIPITGSGDIELVKKPVSALKYKLTPEQWYMIWTAVKGHKVP